MFNTISIVDLLSHILRPSHMNHRPASEGIVYQLRMAKCLLSPFLFDIPMSSPLDVLAKEPSRLLAVTSIQQLSLRQSTFTSFTSLLLSFLIFQSFLKVANLQKGKLGFSPIAMLIQFQCLFLLTIHRNKLPKPSSFFSFCSVFQKLSPVKSVRAQAR